jgi:hypothetical protein
LQRPVDDPDTRVNYHTLWPSVYSHTPEWIDFSPSFARLPLAVDAATMLEGFHSYAQELYLIGKEQEPGSNRQKVPFALAKWFFDAGDRARLTVTAGF